MKNHPVGSCKLELTLIVDLCLGLSMDIKVMPKSSKAHKFILCVIDEVTNYLITMPLISGEILRSQRGTNRKHYNEILYSWAA